jgi:glycolate oxidase FAD binding subunit
MSGSAAGDREAAVRERVRTLLGEEGCGPPPETVLGAPDPLPVAVPAGPEEAAALLRVAGEKGWRVLPVGAGVGLDLPALGAGGRPDPLSGGLSQLREEPNSMAGGRAASPDLLLSSRRLRGVSAYEPADLTLVAGAGTTLSELDAVTGPRGQWLPLDPPGGGSVTLGGVVSTGLAGPLGTAFGRPRDQVLGLTLVDGEGRILPLGGRVVKNVAGFDLVRLACGSRGTLGAILQVSVRLYPLPRTDRTLVWGAADRAGALDLGLRLASLPLPLSSAEVLDGPMGDAEEEPPGPRVLVRLLGEEEVVDRLHRDLEEAAGPADGVLQGGDSKKGARRRSEEEGQGRPFFRIQALPTELPEVLRTLEEGSGSAGTEAGGAQRLAVHLHSGTVRLWGGGVWGSTGTGSDRPMQPGLRRLHERLRAIFDPREILPGAWRDAWR